MGRIDIDTVEAAFGPVVVDPGQKATIELVTARFVELARTVITNVPDCAHRSAALRDILQAKMMCVDAIAKGGLI
jgi:hypothetical protein